MPFLQVSRCRLQLNPDNSWRKRSILRPTKFGLVIGLATAKALGPTISPSLLLRADEAIQ
jgi:hypothetical protein